MSTKVVLPVVEYGIGVQNRYSAFLDDEEGFILSSPNIAKQRAGCQILTSTKQTKVSANSSSSAHVSGKPGSQVGKLNGRQNGSSNNKQDQQKVDHQQKRIDGKRQRPNQQQHSGATNNVQAPNKQANIHRHVYNNQDDTANNTNNRFVRPNGNHNHQSNVSQQNSALNKENGESSSHGKFARNNFQRGENRRQFNNDDKPKFVGQQEEVNSYGNNIAAQSSEEEKLRRQQKRALDLKHKDLEKRDARRQQAHSNNEQSNVENGTDFGQGEMNLRRQGNRRPTTDGVVKTNQDELNRGFRGTRRGRREGPEANFERRDGQPVNRGPRTHGDRPQRNRNGFETGSRGSRGSRSDDADRPKPIPNFSDKLDFPSLAS